MGSIRKKNNLYRVIDVDENTLVKCANCKKTMTYVKCALHPLVSILNLKKKIYEHGYKCKKCNLWQYHTSDKWRDSLKSRKK